MRRIDVLPKGLKDPVARSEAKDGKPGLEIGLMGNETKAEGSPPPGGMQSRAEAILRNMPGLVDSDSSSEGQRVRT